MVDREAFKQWMAEAIPQALHKADGLLAYMEGGDGRGIPPCFSGIAPRASSPFGSATIIRATLNSERDTVSMLTFGGRQLATKPSRTTLDVEIVLDRELLKEIDALYRSRERLDISVADIMPMVPWAPANPRQWIIRRMEIRGGADQLTILTVELLQV